MKPQDPQAEKIHKVLARSGLGSRRDVENLVREGRVKVNSHVASIGQRVDSRARIQVDGKVVKVLGASQGRVIMYHKPVGRICTRDDPQGRPTVFEELPRLRGLRWVSVGRLDFNTSGVMLFTTDGELANRLAHPSSRIEREYLCRVQGKILSEMLDRLRAGVTLDERPAKFESVSYEGGKGSNRWYRVTIMEGRYREVRRMWSAVGGRVSRLIRVRYGPIVLPRQLKPGATMDLDKDVVTRLYQS
ncbi:MAG: hypothetical protein DHS20C01_26270 [marine bacterium B5-7]|nr:MAG: hypothetical protein DHS20C01_26270 [marine bacterium B5-7]